MLSSDRSIVADHYSETGTTANAISFRSLEFTLKKFDKASNPS
jgi:hypothetical protein